MKTILVIIVSTVVVLGALFWDASFANAQIGLTQVDTILFRILNRNTKQIITYLLRFINSCAFAFHLIPVIAYFFVNLVTNYGKFSLKKQL